MYNDCVHTCSAFCFTFFSCVYRSRAVLRFVSLHFVFLCHALIVHFAFRFVSSCVSFHFTLYFHAMRFAFIVHSVHAFHFIVHFACQAFHFIVYCAVRRFTSSFTVLFTLRQKKISLHRDCRKKNSLLSLSYVNFLQAVLF